MTEAATERQQKPFWKNPWFLLSQLASGISLVKLMQDFDWFSLKGVIAEWVAFYNKLVMAVVELLTGWIPIPWMRITEGEAHVIVLCSLVGATMAKIYRLNKLQRTGRLVGTTRLFSAVSWPGMTVLSVMLSLLADRNPGVRDVLLGVGALGLLLLVMLIGAEDLARRTAMVHLGSILGWAAAIILVGHFIGG